MGTTLKKIAVYRIRNIVSGKFYIGSSSNLYERWRTHRQKLRSGKHPNQHLLASWTKHGEEAFKFEILKEFICAQKMMAYEERLITKNINDPLCMNLTAWVDTPMRGRTGKKHPRYGVKLSEAEKDVIRQSTNRQWQQSDPRTGHTHSSESRKKISIKVRQAIEEGRGGKFIPTEETRKKMSEALKGNQCAKGYKRTEVEREAIRQRTLGNQHWLGKTHTMESRKKMGRAVIAVSPEGKETTYDTISFLQAETGLLSPTINRSLKTSKPLSKGKFAGWLFRYVLPLDA